MLAHTRTCTKAAEGTVEGSVSMIVTDQGLIRVRRNATQTLVVQGETPEGWDGEQKNLYSVLTPTGLVGRKGTVVKTDVTGETGNRPVYTVKRTFEWKSKRLHFYTKKNFNSSKIGKRFSEITFNG